MQVPLFYYHLLTVEHQGNLKLCMFSKAKKKKKKSTEMFDFTFNKFYKLCTPLMMCYCLHITSLCWTTSCQMVTNNYLSFEPIELKHHGSTVSLP